MILPGSSIAKTAAINKETATVASDGVINLEEEVVGAVKVENITKAVAVGTVGAARATKVGKAMAVKSVGAVKVEKKEEVEAKAESSSSVGAAKVDDKKQEENAEVEAKDESCSDGEPAPIVAFDSVKQKKEEVEKMEGAFGVAECRFSDAGEAKRRRRSPSVP